MRYPVSHEMEKTPNRRDKPNIVTTDRCVTAAIDRLSVTWRLFEVRRNINYYQSRRGGRDRASDNIIILCVWGGSLELLKKTRVDSPGFDLSGFHRVSEITENRIVYTRLHSHGRLDSTAYYSAVQYYALQSKRSPNNNSDALPATKKPCVIRPTEISAE